MGEHLSRETGRLFARPSFWRGVASVIDLRGSFIHYNQNRLGRKADFHSLRSDWWAALSELRDTWEMEQGKVESQG